MMLMSGTCTRPPLDWAAVGRAAPGQVRSGDMCVVVETDDGVLVSVIDALGHGNEAADVADKCAGALREHAELPLDELVLHCHGVLHGTRGCVLGIVRFSSVEAAIVWTGVGNVDGALVRAPRLHHTGAKREGMLVLGGVVGGSMTPRMKTARHAVSAGDLVLLSSDGVRPGYVDAINALAEPTQIASEVVSRHARGNDDVMMLVVRVGGGA